MNEIIFIVGAVALVIGLVLVVHGTITKTKWGINLSPPKNCPTCNEKLPMARPPKGSQEALWGGWSCQACATKLDKWGRIRE